MLSPQISVIVPTLREDMKLTKHLSDLNQDPEIEVLIITADQAGRANRGSQMNIGAGQARSELLVFLHADTQIDPHELKAVAKKLRSCPQYVGGAFRFTLDHPSWKARLVEWGVGLRVGLFELPYGDQVIFVRSDIFHQVGGYPVVPALEDVLLIQAIKSHGKIYLPSVKAVTSARCWEQNGYLKTTLVNWSTMILWNLGVSLETIKNFRSKRLRSTNRKKYASLSHPS